MSDAKDTAQGTAAAASMKFKDMSLGQKLAHIGKSLLCLVSLGFIYPNIFVD